MSSNDPSYIDYTAILSPTFTPHSFANTLIHSTNNPTDSPLDLSTPLSRVLFDVQEIDTHIDTLTTTNALPIISHTSERSEAASRILESVEEQVKGLNESYARLEREVRERYEKAEEVRVAAEQVLGVLRLGRGVQRAVQLGRQLEGQVEELGKTAGYRSMVPAAHAVLGLRQLFASSEGEGLGRVQVVNTLRQEVVTPAERGLLTRAQQVVREFSMSGLLGGQQQHGPQTQTFAQAEETKNRATSALQTLYLLSPLKASTTTAETFEATLLISALQTYLQTALTSSLAALSRALATLPSLERTLLEISARCQNIVALEVLLESIKPPSHPLLTPTATTSAPTSNFLTPLLKHLDTSSLPSYFWRSMASQLSPRVQDILTRGGVSARTLRTNRERVRDAIRECVDRGSRLPKESGLGGSGEGRKGGGIWEREAAVMVQSVIGPLGR